MHPVAVATFSPIGSYQVPLSLRWPFVLLMKRASDDVPAGCVPAPEKKARKEIKLPPRIFAQDLRSRRTGEALPPTGKRAARHDACLTVVIMPTTEVETALKNK